MALPSDYESRPAKDKLGLLWEQIAADPYPEDDMPRRVPGGWERRKLFSVDFNRASFEHVGDEMPEGRPKLVHTYGTAAPITMHVDDARGYTGMFADGGAAIIRFSDASGGGKSPSLAIKFGVDGKPSLNYLALPYRRRDPEDRNPLTGVYANASPPPDAVDTKLVAWSFQRTANALGGKRLYAVYLPLHHLAGMRSDGTKVDDPNVPDRLELHGTAEAREAMTDHKDWRRSLASLPAGTKLFELRIAPKIDAEAEPYGHVTLDEPFVASRYGDERLFFQHDVGPR